MKNWFNEELTSEEEKIVELLNALPDDASRMRVLCNYHHACGTIQNGGMSCQCDNDE